MNNYLGNPFTTIKTIETSQELLDIAFKKSMKIKPPKEREGSLEKARTHEINRVNTVSNILTTRIDRIVTNFPSLSQLHPFYLELIEIISDINDLKQILGRIYGIGTTIRQITQDIIGDLIDSDGIHKVKKIRKSAFGRYSSLIYQITPFLDKLEKIRKELSILPSYNATIPCVVVCGIPNAGKSSFIRMATSGKPEVANYPFTTKKLIFGHRDFSFLKIQFVDTPGLLDRDFEERNEIELQALAALKHLADIMIFLFDLTKNTSTTQEEQLNLLREIKLFYPSSEFLIIFTKSDMLTNEEIKAGKELLINKELIESSDEVLVISTMEKDGINKLIEKISVLLKNQIIKSNKFQAFMDIEIDPELIPEDDELLWFLDG